MQHVVIAGCGRVGSGLARDIEHEGFDVCVIDENPDAFYLLGENFRGQMVQGPALEWDVLRKARLKDAAAFVACTDGDNTNLVVAQIEVRSVPVREDCHLVVVVRTVIAHENDNCVVELIDSLQVIAKSTDAVIKVVQHRRVHRHSLG